MFKNRSQQSKTEVKARIEESQNSSHEQTCFLQKKPVEYQYSSSSRKKPVEYQYSSSSRKKPVESQYSSSSRKKTHTFTIIAMNFVQEQLKTETAFNVRTSRVRRWWY